MLYWLAWILFNIMFKILFRWRVEGRNNLPKTGGVILAPNHISYADPPVVGTAVNRKVYFMAKQELFEIPIFGEIIKAVSAYPVKRGVPDRTALRNTLKLLEEGKVVCVFPEGTRSPNGKLQEPELGCALLALKSHAPVVPMALIDTDKVLPRHSYFFKLATMKVRVGKPMYFDEFYNKPINKQLLLTVANKVMQAIAKLQKDH